ncbi:unnamed protein product [Lactuca saligna]|uniref:Uncharacterized protein n=1 Tax=Lactuca saligna TaxID=75948 RepID=A0AA36A1M9_LACSI|nr:unnamed protein product [Lactuca saligna]
MAPTTAHPFSIRASTSSSMDFWFSNLIRLTAVVDDARENPARFRDNKEMFTVMDEVLAAAHQVAMWNRVVSTIMFQLLVPYNMRIRTMFYHLLGLQESFHLLVFLTFSGDLEVPSKLSMNTLGRLRCRTEIAPDQSEKLFAEIQISTTATKLHLPGMPPIS